MLRIKLEEIGSRDRESVETEIFSEEYLISRPLLDAIRTDGAEPPVLLIDEIDRADMEFEAFLLEVLSDFQISIPEVGHHPGAEKTLTSSSPPTAPGRFHDALKRRCLYHWIEYPTFEKEYEIIMTKHPEIRKLMAEQICAFMQQVRQMNFYKRPGVAETLDWASALLLLNRAELDPEIVKETVGCVFKYREDLHHLEEELSGEKLDMDRILKEPATVVGGQG